MKKAGAPAALDPKALVTAPEAPAPEAEAAAELAEPTVSRQTLEQTSARSLTFLRGVGTLVSVRAKLAARGYTPAEHARGWRLLKGASGDFGEAPRASADDAKVQGAIAELDAWDEDGLRIVNAALRARHPAQHAFVMRGLKASAGVEAVVGVATLLDRLDALEGAPEREGTRAADRAALATLAARGVDAGERARLRGLVERAQAFAGIEGPGERAAFEERVRAALVEQRHWFEEWSDVARSVIKRRDQLIRLGLAARRSARQAGEGPDGEPGEGPAEEPSDEPGDGRGTE